MTKFAVLSSFIFVLSSCASNGYDDEMLEKYPKCYHHNVKIYQRCIKKNESGEPTTALEIENKALPGQYKQ